jgi:hypothetical protein
VRRLMDERPLLRHTRNLGLALLLTAALLFLANTLSAAEFKRGDGLSELFSSVIALFSERGTPAPLLFPPIVWTLMRGAFWISLLLFVIYMVGTRQGRRELPGFLKMLLQAVLFGLVIGLILNVVGTAINDEEEVAATEEPPPEEIPFEDATVADLAAPEESPAFAPPESSPAEAVLVIIGTLTAVLLLVLLWQWWRYQSMLKTSGRQPIDELRISALLALQELRQGRVPLTDVIRRCYREMTQTVQAQRGVFRQPNVTPREFSVRLLEIGLPPSPVLRLTRLFEQVRYGNAATGERETREAIDSLEQIVAACEQAGNLRNRV